MHDLMDAIEPAGRLLRGIPCVMMAVALCFASGSGQAPAAHRWAVMTTLQGLPSNGVNAILEDADGWLWIGTDAGLVRVDGRSAEPVPPLAPLLEASVLPSRRIRALALDSRGALWIGTEAGLAVRQGNRIGVVEELRGQPVAAMAAAPNDEMAVVTDRGEFFRFASGRSFDPSSERALPRRAGDPPGSRVIARLSFGLPSPRPGVACLPTGAWVVTSEERGPLALAGTELRVFDSAAPRPRAVTALFGEGERLWIGERDGTLWEWRDGRFTRGPRLQGTPLSMHGHGGEMWAASEQGAFRLRGEGAGLRVVEHLTVESTGGELRSNRVRAVFRDRAGIVWFGTDRGLCRYDRMSFQTSRVGASEASNVVRALLPAASGEIWCGTDRGLFRLSDRARETEMDEWIEAPEARDRAVQALAEDDAGRLWVGLRDGGLVRTGSTFSRWGAGEDVRAFARFRGDFYAAVFGRGLERLAGERPELVSNAAFAQRVLALAAEGDAALWMGTEDGELWRYDGQNFQQVTVPFSRPGETAIRAMACANGQLWLATAQGLWLRDKGTLRRLLPELDLSALLFREGVIWLADRTQGLVKFRPQEQLSIHFDAEQGVSSSRGMALALSPEGDVLLGTDRGVTRHRPNSAPPRLALRRFVSNRVYSPEYLVAEMPLDDPQRSFLLEVQGLDSRTLPQQFQYEFVLTNRTQKPARRFLLREPQLIVEALRPAPYIVTVRAINRDLEFSPPLTIRLRVHAAAFPRVLVALATLLVLATGIAIWALWRLRRRPRD